MVYGSDRGDPPSIIEGNYVEASQEEGGIVIGGGPASVRNNVCVNNAYGGISAQNYGGRNLQRNVWIVHNTLISNNDSGINVQGWSSGNENVIAFNAILPRTGTSVFRPTSPAGTIVGNISCITASSCFVNANTPPYDLWPSSASPLLDSAGGGAESWRPVDDFMGIIRGSKADVGAFENTSLVFDHLVGDRNPRPPRVSVDSLPPLSPKNLRIE
jgi:hypothetical protein